MLHSPSPDLNWSGAQIILEYALNVYFPAKQRSLLRGEPNQCPNPARQHIESPASIPFLPTFDVLSHNYVRTIGRPVVNLTVQRPFFR